MGYQVLQSAIYKYNHPPHKNSRLKSNITKINTQINMKQSNWKAWIWWTFHNKSKVLFTVSFSSFSILLPFLCIPANLLTYQRCWHIKINLLSLLIYLIKLNLVSSMLQFYLIFDSQDCYWMSWRDFLKAIKCNYLFIW